ncbi:PAS-domain containing protein [Ruixingdingia sedimenti]|uniref:histidine kinase n=1 Tax=Ruixingdingia sedimenti TaxID=3073604 RepID=A0ABU1F6T8_9RHOB|nr:PAS-domain containing protein [Xinfangfangia sp. LG-4]MDR5652582.1 PAS-domain containing protein [Xinfangfangia sp. LG-4]
MPLTDDARDGLIRAGLNLIQQGLSIFDSDLQLAVWNRRYQEMFQLPDRFVTIGAGLEDTVRFLAERGEYGLDRSVEEIIRWRMAKTRETAPHYMEHARPDGRWIAIEASPLPQGGLVTVYTDITEIKLQEALLRTRSEVLSDQLLAHAERLGHANRELAAQFSALQATKRELTEIESRTRLTTEMMPAHIAHLDRNLRYTFSNRRLGKVLPGRPSDIVGRDCVDVLGEGAFAQLEANLRLALDGEPSAFEFTDPVTGRRIRSAFTPDRIGEGPINGVYVLSMDVTQEALAREALTQTRKREMAAQLTSGLAHDFGNLLTIILGLQTRLDRMDLPAPARDLVQATLAAARRGGVLLDRIGSIAGRRSLRQAPAELAVVIEEAAVLARGTLPDHIRLEVGPVPVRGRHLLDTGALQDSLVNLILNARDAMGAAGGTIRLETGLTADGGVEIAVSDDGPGFSPEALDHALDPFFTTKGGEGSGLGLAMVNDHLKIAGGTVDLSNRPGGGARVALRMPLRPAAPVQDRSRMVMLVEDVDEIRESVRGMLRSLGHRVIEAASAEEALDLADLPGIDTVLSDIMLPGAMTGVDLAETLTARGLPLQICLMTSLPQQHPLRQRAEARFPLLPKPFDAPALTAALAALPPPSSTAPGTSTEPAHAQ